MSVAPPCKGKLLYLFFIGNVLSTVPASLWLLASFFLPPFWNLVKIHYRCNWLLNSVTFCCITPTYIFYENDSSLVLNNHEVLIYSAFALEVFCWCLCFCFFRTVLLCLLYSKLIFFKLLMISSFVELLALLFWIPISDVWLIHLFFTILFYDENFC